MSEHDHDHDHGHHADEEHDEHEAEAEARRRLALAQIRQYPDSALRLRANEVTEFDDDLVRLVERMTILMHDAQGVGLAATQVGILRRLFVFTPGEDEDARAIVNPRIVDPAKETSSDEEGCLSLQGVRVPVERTTELVLEGQDERGKDVRLVLEGLPARVVQHEIDHLDGVLIVDRTDSEHRKQALSTLRPRTMLTR